MINYCRKCLNLCKIPYTYSRLLWSKRVVQSFTQKERQNRYYSRTTGKGLPLPSNEDISKLLRDPSYKKKCVERLERLKARRTGYKDLESGFGVLVPLCIVEGQYCLIYTKRTLVLSSHAGEVSFPGGRIDKTDKSVTDAALREAEEELGIDKDTVEIWTTMAPVPERRLTRLVTPVLAFIGEVDPSKLKFNTLEVADVFTVPIRHLLVKENQATTTFRHGWTMPVFLNARHKIWGFTAIATDMTLASLFPRHHQLLIVQKSEKISDRYISHL